MVEEEIRFVSRWAGFFEEGRERKLVGVWKGNEKRRKEMGINEIVEFGESGSNRECYSRVVTNIIELIFVMVWEILNLSYGNIGLPETVSLAVESKNLKSPLGSLRLKFGFHLWTKNGMNCNFRLVFKYEFQKVTKSTHKWINTHAA